VEEDGVVRSYRDLWVWKEGMDLAEMCYEVTKAFPREEVFGMTSQVRRAATAIPANIAEGCGR
jgi:four helix bundle protein